MIPYFLLLLIPLFLQILLQANHTNIKLGNHSTVIRSDNIALPTFFFLFLLVLALRDDTIGRDLPTYKYMFQFYGQLPIADILADSREVLFRLYCWAIYNWVSDNYQLFLAITAIISVLPMSYVYNQDKSHGYLKIAIFVNMSTFIMLFSGIRQGLAMSIGLMAYQALKEKKDIMFFFWSIVAAFIHHTGFMVLLFYPLYKMRFKKRDLIWILPSIFLVIVFNRQIFNFLSSLIGAYDDKYGVLAESTGAFGSFLLFGMFSIFSYVITDEGKMDAEAFALRNILIFAAVMQSFASLNALAMRMNYYFILLIPYALGKSIQCTRLRYIRVAAMGELVIAIYFTWLFISGTYHSYLTGISTLDTIPYVPFWKG